MKRIREWARMLFYENGELSYTRLISAIFVLAFLGVSFYLVLAHQYWQNYDTFASLTGGGGGATQLVNKFINSKYNSVQGGYASRTSADTVCL